MKWRGSSLRFRPMVRGLALVDHPRIGRATTRIQMVPEPGFEPGPPYGERILSPLIVTFTTSIHNK